MICCIPSSYIFSDRPLVKLVPPLCLAEKMTDLSMNDSELITSNDDPLCTVAIQYEPDGIVDSIFSDVYICSSHLATAPACSVPCIAPFPFSEFFDCFSSLAELESRALVQTLRAQEPICAPDVYHGPSFSEVDVP